jgi:diphosphate-dependent phosphofructokinase
MIAHLEAYFHAPMGVFSPNVEHPVQCTKGVVRSELCYEHVFTQQVGGCSDEPLTIGVVFSGGPAPGGHNVIAGILAHLRDQDTLIGFFGGPGGLLKAQHKAIKVADLEVISGKGGFDFLGTDRTKIATADQFVTVRSVVESLGVKVLIIIGGDDSNTNALYLSDALFGVCAVIGVPKTIDGDLQYLPYVPITFGFHTATQHYATLVRALMIDSKATHKYWHIVKLMGRDSSHVTLEVAHQVQPHVCVLSEEICDKGWGLVDVVQYCAGIMSDRFKLGKPFGVMIFPEGVMDSLVEFKEVMQGNMGPMNQVLAQFGLPNMDVLPVMEDAHGNKNFSLVPTELLMMQLLKGYLEIQDNAAASVKMIPHFFGYTGRGVKPTAFDGAYGLALGKTAYGLALSGVTGVMAGVGLKGGVSAVGLPLTAMVAYDSGRSRHVIQKHLVSMDSDIYRQYAQEKQDWCLQDVGFPRKEIFEIPYAIQLDLK